VKTILQKTLDYRKTERRIWTSVSVENRVLVLVVPAH